MFINKRIKSKKISDGKGFTLIEVLVAMAIFSIGILAVGSMQLSATKGSSSARLSTEAVAIAQARAETLILLPYTDAALNLGDVASGTEHTATEGSYNIIWEVWDSTVNTTWGVTPAANTKVVQVVAKSLRRSKTATITFVKGQDL